MGSMAARPWGGGGRGVGLKTPGKKKRWPAVHACTLPHLGADLGRNTGELGVGRKGAQIVHGLQQRGCCRSALGAVLLREGPVQRLRRGDKGELRKHCRQRRRGPGLPPELRGHGAGLVVTSGDGKDLGLRQGGLGEGLRVTGCRGQVGRVRLDGQGEVENSNAGNLDGLDKIGRAVGHLLG